MFRGPRSGLGLGPGSGPEPEPEPEREPEPKHGPGSGPGPKPRQELGPFFKPNLFRAAPPHPTIVAIGLTTIRISQKKSL